MRQRQVPSSKGVYLHPEDPSQNFAVLDDQSKAIAQRRRFLEAEFNVLAKGGLLPWLDVSTTKESAEKKWWIKLHLGRRYCQIAI
jgi:hypothetical protein